MAAVRGRYARLLREQRVGRLGTLSEDNTIHIVPICYAYDGKAIYIGAETESKKVRNLRRSNKATLVVDVYYEDWRRLMGMMIQGEVELHEDGGTFIYGRRLLYRKYKQYEKQAPLQPRESTIIKLIPKKIITF
ncbi:MAG TPA: hypothetical protein EYH45_03385 [Candidatus Caldiarchaeum subterraneum]|uniref:Pyridoxamine 5'-phosphate oxidase N-terminal domain-containing protein n=1 Tax=Caldiarchaeum subterraneum TaxID=311458 RepID=A0A832ZWG0_CALS0|nr:hypothetical protein [Aigarchaeota archaeon]HIQ29587.1 hypothetical protein [Candidatus Caldarchaeum subterraneum]